MNLTAAIVLLKSLRLRHRDPLYDEALDMAIIALQDSPAQAEVVDAQRGIGASGLAAGDQNAAGQEQSMAAQPDGIPPEQLGIDCASPAKGPEPAPAAPELICPRTSVVCYDPAGQCKPGYCRRQFHPTAPAAPSYHEEVIKARDEGWYRDITPAAYELPREQIAYYRNEIHTGLARAWMDASAHNKQTKEINALCDMALASIERRESYAALRATFNKSSTEQERRLRLHIDDLEQQLVNAGARHNKPPR